ncbi:MAG TPA: hypothetical protein VG796_25860 [Verrucomicrobiales bacterium]|nr:hypothetical protein [Verrucomicrobiales bacterium]
MIFRILCVLLSAAVLPASAAETYPLTIGNVTLEVPIPEGYVAASESEEHYQTLKFQQGAQGNEVLAVFVPAERTNTEDDYNHALGIAMLRKFRDRDCTKEELEYARREMNDKIAPMADKVGQQAGVAVSAQPIHDFSDRHFSFSMRLAVPGKEGCTVTSMALIRGRMWYFFAQNGEGASPEDLIGVKEISKNWLGSIIANNPSDEATLARENSDGLLSFTYTGAIAGAIAGAVIGLVVKLTKKSPRRR